MREWFGKRLDPALAAGMSQNARTLRRATSAFAVTPANGSRTRYESSSYLTVKTKVPLFLMDTGCGRMMGGKVAVQDYIEAAIALGAEPPKFTPGAKPFHVANGQVTHSEGSYWLPGWCGGNKTDFQCDVGNWANVPILLSMTTMRSMHINLQLHPVGDARGSWATFPDGGAYEAQQLVDLPGGMAGFRPCITDPKKEAKLEPDRVYWLEDAGSTCSATEVPDTDFAEDWSELLDPETWWDLQPFKAENEAGPSSFDQEQLEGNVAWAAVDPEVYKRLAAGETDEDELLIAIKAVHSNLGHTRNIEKLMRLFPPGYRDRRVFNRALHKCRDCGKLGKAPSRPKGGGTWLLRATRPGHIYSFDFFKFRSKHTRQSIKCLHWVDIFSGFSMIIFGDPETPEAHPEILRAFKKLRADHGLSEQIVMDRGSANIHEVIGEYLRVCGVTCIPIPAVSPWSNPVERHNLIMEQIIERLDDVYAAELKSGTLTLMDIALEALAAKNEMPGGPAVDGQSSLELKTGRRPRATEMDDDGDEPCMTRSEAVQILCDLRLKAQVAALEARREVALKMALSKKLVPDRTDYERGDVVDFYTPKACKERLGSGDTRRTNRTHGHSGWIGPAVVIGSWNGCYILLHQNRTYWRGAMHLRKIRVAQLDVIARQQCTDELDQMVDRAAKAQKLRAPPHAPRGDAEIRWRRGRQPQPPEDDALEHHPPADDPEPAEQIQGPFGPVDLLQNDIEDGGPAEEEDLVDVREPDPPDPERDPIPPVGAPQPDVVGADGLDEHDRELFQMAADEQTRHRADQQRRWLECDTCHQMRRLTLRQVERLAPASQSTQYEGLQKYEVPWFRCSMIDGMTCRTKQQKGYHLPGDEPDPALPVYYERAQVLPSQIANTLRHMFAKTPATDLNGQLYLFDAESQHAKHSAVAHYRQVYDRGMRLARFVADWTKVAAATIRLRALLHLPAEMTIGDSDWLQIPSGVMFYAPHTQRIQVIRTDYQWERWDFADLELTRERRNRRYWYKFSPSEFETAHWFILWIDAPGPDDDDEPELVPPIIAGPKTKAEPTVSFEPPRVPPKDKRRPDPEPPTPPSRGRDRSASCTSSRRARSEPPLKPSTPRTSPYRRALAGQSDADSSEEGDWTEDNETPTDQWFRAPPDVDPAGRPPPEPVPHHGIDTRTRTTRPPNRWGYDRPGEPGRRLGWNHRGVDPRYYHHCDADAYICKISKACLYGVSTLRSANEVCDIPKDVCGLVEEFFFDFPDPEFSTSTTHSLASFDGLYPAPTDPLLAPAEEGSDPTVRIVLLATNLTKTYVTMRELRATEVSAKTAIGKDWDESRNKEVDAWMSFGAGQVVKRRDYPGTRVLKTRWVYTVKPDGRLKSRLCVRGDIEKRQLAKEGAVPSHESWAPSREADRMYYAITAEMKWVTKSSDYPNAFLQSDEDKLEREILLDLPEEARAHLGMKGDEVFLLHKNAYGTIDAPRAWQRTLQQEYERQGFVIHTTIPTLFLLFDEHHKLEGHSKVHMDDSEYAGGTKRFHDKMAVIQKRFKVPDNKIDVGTYVLCGRQVKQDPTTKDIRVDLKPYAEMIEKIATVRNRDPDSPLAPWEVTEVQRVIGQAIWYCSNAAPHASFRTSMLASMRAQGRYACILSANELVEYIHRNKSYYIHFTRIAGGVLDNLRVLAQHDASKSCVDKHDWTLPLEKMRLKGYAGRVYCFVDVTTLYHQQTKANLVNWRANKLDRVCTAPSSAETLAGVKCTYECIALARDLAVWIWGPAALESATTALQMTDSENLMENIRSDFPKPIDTLLVPDLLAMREHMHEKRTELRWIDTRIMCADPLTKEFEYHEYLEDLAQRNKLTLVFVGEKRKYPKHLDRWEPARTLVAHGTPSWHRW